MKQSKSTHMELLITKDYVSSWKKYINHFIWWVVCRNKEIDKFKLPHIACPDEFTVVCGFLRR